MVYVTLFSVIIKTEVGRLKYINASTKYLTTNKDEFHQNKTILYIRQISFMKTLAI